MYVVCSHIYIKAWILLNHNVYVCCFYIPEDKTSSIEKSTSPRFDLISITSVCSSVGEMCYYGACTRLFGWLLAYTYAVLNQSAMLYPDGQSI